MDYVVLNGCMLEQSIKIKNESVDFILTDPPYAISKDFKPVWKDKDGNDLNTIHDHKFDRNFHDNWDNTENFVVRLNEWAEVWGKKLRKNGSIVVFTGDKYISHLWEALEKHGIIPKRVITWRKPAAVPFNRKVLMISGCEFLVYGIKEKGKGKKRKVFNADPQIDSIQEIFVAADKAGVILNKYMQRFYKRKSLSEIMCMAEKEIKEKLNNMLQNRTARLCIPNIITYSGGLGKNRIHPTEKPVEILKYLISIFSNEGDTILDTFAGSGSTGEAALLLNRNVLLIERDKSLCEKMKKRLEKCKKIKI